MFYFSNHNLERAPVISTLEKDAGLVGRIQRNDIDNKETNSKLLMSSDWEVLA